MKASKLLVLLFVFMGAIIVNVLKAGPYTEQGINGYIDSSFQHADPTEPNAVINPIFRGWATDFQNYLPSDEIGFYDYNGIGSLYGNPFYVPEKTLGPATGNSVDVVSLGDLDSAEIATGKKPGQITLIFGDPNHIGVNDPGHIRNLAGYDFVVFENGFASNYTTEDGSISGQMVAELAYVEVSSDGQNFIRFPTVSLTPQPSGSSAYLTIDITDIYNFAGKHPNTGGICTGTAFDLEELADHPDVQSGLVDIDNISCIRLVDVPGSGDFYDTAMDAVDPGTRPNWDFYVHDNPVYDAWVTWGSGGLDLEAVGVLNEQQYAADINLDGSVDIIDLQIFVGAWLSCFGDDNWVDRCDLANPKDMFINMNDFAVFCSQWNRLEQWRHYP